MNLDSEMPHPDRAARPGADSRPRLMRDRCVKAKGRARLGALG
ncbi:unnamed protein product [Ciceribacter selenitireducens ATCC BAA-1503]|uniref:Uncharacterized protein n=1 Tax=Ciceribacter selenitireducens ATCC BAA-1503 TaxID=1336235 RepID=A0A376AK33_9HYPH|nr:unnamed protein product [Ciceribacter selenitireducens ATCC BAA-1503]